MSKHMEWDKARQLNCARATKYNALWTPQWLTLSFQTIIYSPSLASKTFLLATNVLYVLLTVLITKTNCCDYFSEQATEKKKGFGLLLKERPIEMFYWISPLYLRYQSKWAGEPFTFMMTYLHSNGVWKKHKKKKWDKQVKADELDKRHKHTHVFTRNSAVFRCA